MEKKLKENGKYYNLFTSHPGEVYQIKNNNIYNIYPYDLGHAKLNYNYLKNHFMGNYISSLELTNRGGRRKKRTKKKSRRRKRKTKKRRKKNK